MDLYEFIDRILDQEFMFCRIHDLENDKELCRGYADDIEYDSRSLIQKYRVVTWYVINDEIFINVRKKEKNENKYI